MVKSISVTSPGVTRYPQHRHGFVEIMYYTFGTGVLKTEYGDYPFTPGTAIIVPPNVLHGSASENGFKNISIGGDFNDILINDKPFSVNAVADAAALSDLIYKNRFGGAEYLNALADCYVLSLMQAYKTDSQIDAAVKKIVNAVSENACDAEFDITKELRLSGYAEDYIRAKFKELRKETPTEFLNRLRINNACRIIEIYGKQFNVTETAEKTGFSNPAYFSRVFKKIVGVSPKNYYACKIAPAINGK